MRVPRGRRPTKEELQAAYGKGVPDVIAPDLRVLFVGINPGLYTAAIGHHFGRPGNRFWPAVHAGGFSPHIISPYDSRELLKDGYGITNLVNRATARADELTHEELIAGGRRLEAKVRRYKPAFVAIVGLTSYRIAFGRKEAKLGRQLEKMSTSTIWVLPNPSGLNAHYQPRHLARLFGELKRAVDAEHGPPVLNRTSGEALAAGKPAG